MKKMTFEALGKGLLPDAPSITVYDEEGRPLELGAEQELGRGKSGRVFTLPGAPQFCAKIYSPDLLADPVRQRALVLKLKAMLRIDACRRDPRLCWPQGLLRANPGGKVIGFVMRKLPDGSRPFVSLFGGARAVQRVRPGWGRRQLARLAQTFVEELARLEAENVRVADFNPRNFAFTPDGAVTFVDCDSYSLLGFDGTAYASETYDPESAAPELLMDLARLKQPRTAEACTFSAHVLAFRIVQMGEHPFSFLETPDGPRLGTPAENIKAGYTALGGGTGLKRAPHPYALWSWLPATLQQCFLRTFRDGHRNPAARATLEELAFGLQKFAFECERTPERDSLAPDAPKPRRSAEAPASSYAPPYGAPSYDVPSYGTPSYGAPAFGAVRPAGFRTPPPKTHAPSRVYTRRNEYLVHSDAYRPFGR